MKKQSLSDSIRPKVKELFVPLWNQTILMRKLSVGDARRISNSIHITTKKKTVDSIITGIENYVNQFMSSCLLDMNYKPIFTLKEVKDLDLDIYNFLSIEVCEYNGINFDYKKAREELKKKSV